MNPYHVIYVKNYGYSIYKSKTDQPWMEALVLVKCFSHTPDAWCNPWSGFEEPHFHDCCIGSFSDIDNAIECAVLDTL